MIKSKDHKTSRIQYLDSIRGIAAMIVVVFHFMAWRWGDTLQFNIAAFVFNGTEAVSFFFVLSGFVLSYSYVNSSRKIEFGRYLYKRILRLYPAYVLNILLLFIYDLRDYSFESIFIRYERVLPIKEWLMFQDTHDLYVPGWTLQIEIIYSVIIIGLILLYRKHPYWLLLPLIGSYVIGSPDIRLYMNHFIMGICLSIIYPKLKDVSFAATRFYPWRWAIYALIFVLFSFVNIARFFKPIDDMFHLFWTYNIRWAHFSGFAAFLFLIIVMMSKNIQALLENKVLLYLGKISYSIYLIHWIIGLFIMNNWQVWGQYLGEGAFRVFVMFILFIGASVFAADLMYRFIEAPFIRISKLRNVTSQK